MYLKINPNAQFSHFDDATLNNKWLCCLPDQFGKTYQFTLPEGIYNFIQMFDGSSSLIEIKNAWLLKQQTDENQWLRLEALLDDFLLVKKIIIDGNLIAEYADDQNNKAAHMQVQYPLLTARIVNPIAAALQFLYHTKLATLLIIVGIIGQIYFYLSFPFDILNAWKLSAVEQIWLILITGLGLLFHELGHASAAYRFGSRRVEVGIGWYICFFVFYAELSESWRLSRKQRCIIDSAGLYFQSLFTLALIICHQYTNSAILAYAIILLNVSFLWNLNPFFRMDGYWLASDILGIANLRETTKQEFNRILCICLGQKIKPRVYQLSAGTSQLLIVYTVLSNIFFCWMIYFILHRLFYIISVDLSAKFDLLTISKLVAMDTLTLIVFILGITFQLLMFSFFCVFLWRALLSAWRLTQIISAKLFHTP